MQMNSEKNMINLGTKSWNDIYQQKGISYVSSLEYLPELVNLFNKHNIKRVIDFGCGTGAHILYLVQHGFEVYGIDISEEAIKIAKGAFKEIGQKGDIRIASMYNKLPYETDFFDAIISFRAINHAKIDDIRKSIKEIERILKPHGLVFITVPAAKPGRRRQSSTAGMIDSRTRIHLAGEEKDVIHYIFNKELLRKEFSNFKIHDLRIGDYKVFSSTRRLAYYRLIGELRSK